MKIKSQVIFFSFFSVMIFLIINSCKKDPYDDVDYDTDTTTTLTADPNTIVGLHKNIFFPMCALPACHDGTFEPNYLTVQSTYSTLVYHPVGLTTLNDTLFFTFRVKAYDTTYSLLHELVTTDNDQNFMPRQGNRLTQDEISHINNWIMNGARDEYGNIATAPDLPPYDSAYIFVAFDSLVTIQYNVDSNRVGGIGYNPFIVSQNQYLNVAFFIRDDSTSVANLTVNRLKLSLDKNDFSSAATVNAFYFSLYNIWVAPFHANYPVGTQVYMRYYVNDGHHTSDTETPRSDMPDVYKSYFSFIVQ
jgi:hypothetical protein